MSATGWVESDRNAYKAVVRLPDGTRRSKNFAIKKYGAREAKREAGNWQRELVLAVERGTSTDPRNQRTTFAVWVKQLQLTEAATLRDNTRAQHEHIFKNHLVPAFGELPLGVITQRQVQQFVDDLTAAGLAPATVRKCYQILYKSLDTAVDAQMLGRNPCRAIMLPPLTKDEMRFLTTTEVANLASVIGAPYKALVMLGAYGGLRIGELAGLRKSRVDLKTSTVEVREIVTEVKGHLAFGPPKTRRGTRNVPIPYEVTAVLERHMVEYGFGDDMVFHSPKGDVLRPNGWRRRIWNPAVVTAGLSTPDNPLTPHALRHTAVAIWIAAEIAPAEIAFRAGHASASFVLDTYGHLFPSGDAAFSARVSRLYVPPT